MWMRWRWWGKRTWRCYSILRWATMFSEIVWYPKYFLTQYSSTVVTAQSKERECRRSRTKSDSRIPYLEVWQPRTHGSTSLNIVKTDYSWNFCRSKIKKKTIRSWFLLAKVMIKNIKIQTQVLSRWSFFLSQILSTFDRWLHGQMKIGCPPKL